MSGAGDAVFHTRIVEILRAVAAKAILPRFKSLAEGDIRAKTHAGDLVTIADEEAELLLAEHFTALLPGSRVVGEEGVAKDAAVLDLLTGDDPVWVIDPIDGTVNFVNGIDRFAMMIALVRKGETTMGWIHDPITGATLVAERGAGAWLIDADMTATARRLPVCDGNLATMTTALHHRVFGAHLGKFERNLRLGSAAHDYWGLAEGRIQIVSYRRLKPWDHAAGILIHAEAGGYARLLDGQPYRPASANQEGLLCAPTAAVWEDVADLTRA